MISLEKEMQIRSLLQMELSEREIACRTKVCKQTVGRIKHSPEVGKRTPRKKIKLKESQKKRCKECGGIIVIEPCLVCHPNKGYYDAVIMQSAATVPSPLVYQKQLTNRVSLSETTELLRIVNDLQEFHKLGLISHPLFRDLARRSRNILQRISLGST